MADSIRAAQAAAINAEQADRERLEAQHGQVWDTAQMQEDFTAVGFAAPYIVVRRKSDGAQGTLTFQHRPRFYWGFVQC